jgi:hypothetical protein
VLVETGHVELGVSEASLELVEVLPWGGGVVTSVLSGAVAVMIAVEVSVIVTMASLAGAG